MLPPAFDDDVRFASVRNHSKLRHSWRNVPLKDFVSAILPGLAGIDKSGLDTALNEPLQDGLTDELRSAAHFFAATSCRITLSRLSSASQFAEKPTLKPDQFARRISSLSSRP